MATVGARAPSSGIAPIAYGSLSSGCICTFIGRLLEIDCFRWANSPITSMLSLRPVTGAVRPILDEVCESSQLTIAEKKRSQSGSSNLQRDNREANEGTNE